MPDAERDAEAARADAADIDVADIGPAEIERTAIERLTFFSDAVVAIAITLLALELPLPEGATTAEFIGSLVANSFEYLTFAIAFAVVGSHWVAHHQVFRYVVGTAPGLVTLNLCWLLLIVTTPFLTRVLREGHLDIARFGLFAIAQALVLLVFAGMQTRVAGAGLFARSTPMTIVRHGWFSGVARALGFLLSIPVYAVAGNAAFLVWLVVPVALGRLHKRQDSRG